MFKITPNTIHRFSFAEILLMAAMNEIEAKRKASATARNLERTS
jgi:signal recognition particle GTPase